MSETNEANVGDLGGVGKLADSKLVNKIYDDALHPAFQQLGMFGEEVIKTARLLLIGVPFGAKLFDRLHKRIQAIGEGVPEERRVEAAPEVVFPALQQLILYSDDNPVHRLYIELLKRAIDKSRCHEAHPAFVKIIDQLSPDEAMVMYFSRDGWVIAERQETLWRGASDAASSYDGIHPRISPDKVQQLVFPVNLLAYISHLIALGIFEWNGNGDSSRWPANQNTDALTIPRQIRMTNHARLSEFGRLFVQACIPEDFSLEEFKRNHPPLRAWDR